MGEEGGGGSSAQSNVFRYPKFKFLALFSRDGVNLRKLLFDGAVGRALCELPFVIFDDIFWRRAASAKLYCSAKLVHNDRAVSEEAVAIYSGLQEFFRVVKEDPAKSPFNSIGSGPEDLW